METNTIEEKNKLEYNLPNLVNPETEYNFFDYLEFRKELNTKRLKKCKDIFFNDSFVHAEMVITYFFKEALEQKVDEIYMYCGKFSLFRNSAKNAIEGILEKIKPKTKKYILGCGIDIEESNRSTPNIFNIWMDINYPTEKPFSHIYAELYKLSVEYNINLSILLKRTYNELLNKILKDYNINKETLFNSTYIKPNKLLKEYNFDRESFIDSSYVNFLFEEDNNNKVKLFIRTYEKQTAKSEEYNFENEKISNHIYSELIKIMEENGIDKKVLFNLIYDNLIKIMEENGIDKKVLFNHIYENLNKFLEEFNPYNDLIHEFNNYMEKGNRVNVIVEKDISDITLDFAWTRGISKYVNNGQLTFMKLGIPIGLNHFFIAGNSYRQENDDENKTAICCFNDEKTCKTLKNHFLKLSFLSSPLNITLE